MSDTSLRVEGVLEDDGLIVCECGHTAVLDSSICSPKSLDQPTNTHISLSFCNQKGLRQR